MASALFYLLGIAVLVIAVYFGVEKLGVPQPLAKVIQAIAVIIGLIAVALILFGLAGHPLGGYAIIPQ